MRPESLAIKAINQYRKRDIISYLGLRYYLMNSSARRNRWINEVSTELTQHKPTPAYFKTSHFKKTDENGNVIPRTIYIPAPNEALAEVALITECSKQSAFQSKNYVFSYQFASENDLSGVFKYYFEGFKERHKAIVSACRRQQCATVLCTDIKKFYPSIPYKVAISSWKRAANSSSLSPSFKSLGYCLLEKHLAQSQKDNSGKCLLTGPIFSHLIANLALTEIDEKMWKITNGKYWRYVDDIAMLGSNDELESWRATLKKLFEELELELHTGDKDYSVTSCEWLTSENDFNNDTSQPWMRLIGDIKKFLLANPHKHKELTDTFSKLNINLPIIHYSEEIYEKAYLQKIKDRFAAYRWSWKNVKALSINTILDSITETRTFYHNQITSALSEYSIANEFEKKRLIPKIRYAAGRLTLVAPTDLLLKLAEELYAVKELFLLSEIMRAVASRDVSRIILLGTNATQAAAQLLKTSNLPVTFSTEKLSYVARTSLAILKMNGIQFSNDFSSNEYIYTFATGENIQSLMNSEDPFIREISSLHGVQDSLHDQMLNTAFDRDEELAIDLINQLQQSSYA